MTNVMYVCVCAFNFFEPPPRVCVLNIRPSFFSDTLIYFLTLAQYMLHTKFIRRKIMKSEHI